MLLNTSHLEDVVSNANQPVSLQQLLISFLAEQFACDESSNVIRKKATDTRHGAWPHNIAAVTKLPGALAATFLPDHLIAQIYETSMRWRRSAADQPTSLDVQDGTHDSVSVPISVIRPFYNTTHITKLRLNDLNDANAREITAAHLPKLQSICVEHSPALTDAGMTSALIACAATLHFVALRNCASLSPDCLIDFLNADSSSHLAQLVVRACPSFAFSTQEQAQKLFALEGIRQHLTRLSIDICWAEQNDTPGETYSEIDMRSVLALSIGRIETLTHLSVPGFSQIMSPRLWWDEGMSMSRMCSLDLSHCKPLNAIDLNNFVIGLPVLMPFLSHLDLSNTNARLTEVLFSVIPRHDDASAGCPNLQSLVLSDVPCAYTYSFRDDVGSLVAPTLCLSLARCDLRITRLFSLANTHTLDLSGNEIMILPDLSSCELLKVLDVSDCLCSEFLGLPEGLKELRCHNNSISDIVLECLRKLKHLRVLWIDGSFQGFTDPLHVIADAIDSFELELTNVSKKENKTADCIDTLEDEIHNFLSRFFSDKDTDSVEKNEHSKERFGIAQLNSLEELYTTCEMADQELAALPFVFKQLEDVRVAGRGMVSGVSQSSKANMLSFSKQPSNSRVETTVSSNTNVGAEDVVRQWLAVHRGRFTTVNGGSDADVIVDDATMHAQLALLRMGYDAQVLGMEISQMRITADQHLLKILEHDLERLVDCQYYMNAFVSSVDELDGTDGPDCVMARGPSFDSKRSIRKNSPKLPSALRNGRASSHRAHGEVNIMAVSSTETRNRGKETTTEWESPICCRCSVCVERVPELYTNPFKIVYTREELTSIHRRVHIEQRVNVRVLHECVQDGSDVIDKKGMADVSDLHNVTSFRKRPLEELVSSSPPHLSSSSSSSSSPKTTVDFRQRGGGSSRSNVRSSRTGSIISRWPSFGSSALESLGSRKTQITPRTNVSTSKYSNSNGSGITSNGGSEGTWR